MRIAIGSSRREVRVAILFAIVAGAGALALHLGLRTTGIGLCAMAAAIVAAFYLLVVRPARIPHGAVLTIRLAGAMRENAPRSPLEQLRGRHGPTLFDLRQALEGAARDPRISAVVVRIAGLETGLATADELSALLRALGRAGKRCVNDLGNLNRPQAISLMALSDRRKEQNLLHHFKQLSGLPADHGSILL
jgi:hypothetical protein